MRVVHAPLEIMALLCTVSHNIWPEAIYWEVNVLHIIREFGKT